MRNDTKQMVADFVAFRAEMMPRDLEAHPLPFGGLALVPVSDAGRDWLTLWPQMLWGPCKSAWPTFHAPDGCMEALPDDAIGFEPQDWPEIVTAARDAGLIVGGIF